MYEVMRTLACNPDQQGIIDYFTIFKINPALVSLFNSCAKFYLDPKAVNIFVNEFLKIPGKAGAANDRPERCWAGRGRLGRRD